jgi:hypothetical protein
VSNKGRPHYRSVQWRTLVDLLVNDPAYQRKLREDWRRRRVHPSIECAIWAYHAGKPRESVDITFDLGEHFAAERDLLLGLSLGELETLAAESEALVRRALDTARSPQARLPDIAVDTLQSQVTPESLDKSGGSDNQHSVTLADPSVAEPTSPAIPEPYHDPSRANDGDPQET